MNVNIKKAKELAFANLDNCYAKYSNFRVSAICYANGNFYQGVNIENASYPLTICAERAAMFNAISNGENKDSIDFVLIVTKSDKLTYPCGACRQVMIELLKPTTKIILCNEKEYQEVMVKDLLPYAFTQEDL